MTLTLRTFPQQGVTVVACSNPSHSSNVLRFVFSPRHFSEEALQMYFMPCCANWTYE
jgi:hypothetical protein